MAFLFFFIVSFTLSTIFVPFIIKIGTKFRLFDQPDIKRKRNYKEKVRIGGIAPFLSILLSIFICFFLNQFNIYPFEFELNYYLISSLIFYFFLGLFEDIYGIRLFKRLLMQILFGIFIWKFGYRVETLNLFFPFSNQFIFELSNFTSLIFSILWFAGLVNAINWIDGLDGLAAGQSIIMLLAISYICFQNNFLNEGIIGIIIAGSFLGFLKYNYYPSSVLMGDGGSYLLGSSLAFLSLISTSNFNQIYTQPLSSNINLLIIYPILFIPLTDMIFVIAKRFLSNSSIFYPDRRHFHYYLHDSGINHNATVKIVICMTLFFSSVGLAIFTKNIFLIFFPFLIMAYQLYNSNVKS